MTQQNSIISLNSLLNLSNKLNESTDKEFILYSTMLSFMGKLLISKASIYIRSGNYQYKLLTHKGNFEIKFHNSDLPNTITDLTEIRENCIFCEQGVNFIIPLVIDSKIDAVFFLGKSLIEHSLSDDEIHYISLVSTICSTAVKNALTINSFKVAKERAERHSQLLSTLFEVGRDFSTFINKEQILRTLTLNLMGQLMVSRFAIFYIEENNTHSELVNRFSRSFDGAFLEQICTSELASKVEVDEDVSIVAPMKVKGIRKGLMLIGKKLNAAEFSDNDLLFIEALGNTAIAALENERLFREELEKKKLENELNIALEIQRNLLPKSEPILSNFDIYGSTIPSRHVGGDYFDYIQLSANKYLLAIADVSGKGIPASLIMANMQAALHLLSNSKLPLSEIIRNTNNLIYQNTSADKFVTGFFCIIDNDESSVEFLNAGHNPPYLIKNNNIETLNDGGLILGFMPNPPSYQSRKIILEQGQVIVCFTDGVNEARDKLGNEYGDERIITVSTDHQQQLSKDIGIALLDDVQRFVNGNVQYDDITLLIIKHK